MCGTRTQQKPQKRTSLVYPRRLGSPVKVVPTRNWMMNGDVLPATFVDAILRLVEL